MDHAGRQKVLHRRQQSPSPGSLEQQTSGDQSEFVPHDRAYLTRIIAFRSTHARVSLWTPVPSSAAILTPSRKDRLLYIGIGSILLNHPVCVEKRGIERDGVTHDISPLFLMLEKERCDHPSQLLV